MDFDGHHAEVYRPDLAADWDAICDVAAGGTVLQSRRFLDYHGERFTDLSLVGHRQGEGRPSWVLPMAADPRQADRVVSHPGTSFGGLVSLGHDPAHARAILRGAAGWLMRQGFVTLLYRMPPAAVLRQPDEGLLPDLLQMGQVVQLDLWSVLQLQGPVPARNYWRSEIRRAERKGLRAEPVETSAQWAEVHGLLAARLGAKYGKTVVHSVAELVDLHGRLGAQSRGMLVRDADSVALAGLWFIDYGTGVLHNQYNGASAVGLALGASSYGISLALERALTEGFRAFSFGRSTNEDGWTENRALLRFKAGFGAGLASQFHIELPLDRLAGLRH